MTKQPPSASSPSAGPPPYHRLGRTTLQVSVLGFGASPLGNAFGQTDPAETTAAVRYAIERGINFFDVSPYYGHTLAETRLGEALEDHREKIVLATKCGRYGAEEFDFSPKRITAEVENSLLRLRTDHVDLLQAHDVEFTNVQQIVGETLPAMRRLQQQGKARFLGITGYSLRNLVEIARQAEVDSILSYCRCNLLVSDIDQALVPFAQQHGIGLINASPLHMGLLTADGAPDWHPAPPEVRAMGPRVAELCKRYGVDVSEAAVSYSLTQPGIATTLVGMSSPAQVESNLRALHTPIPPGLLAEIQQLIAPVHNRTWPSGLAENHG